MESNKLTVFFIHGIGVRSSIEYKMLLQKHLQNHHLVVETSQWGEKASFNKNELEKVFPNHGRKWVPPSLSSEQIQSDNLWRGALVDPLLELKLFLATTSPHNREEEQREDLTASLYERQVQLAQKKHMKEKFTALVREGELSDDFCTKLEQAGIDQTTFNNARKEVVDSEDYEKFVAMFPKTGAKGSYLEAVARAVVARAVKTALETSYDFPILWHRELRENVINEFSESLGSHELGGISDLLRSPVLDALKHLLGDGPSPFLHPNFDGIHYRAGDIVYYLARGQSIRTYVHDEIQALPEPIVILAHSLGGVIAIDLLLENLLQKTDLWKKVKLLITVGSQIPYLYALDSLYSLPKGKPLPPFPLFPRWLNLYDPLDLLSFQGHRIFGVDRVEDKLIESNKLFPDSHNNYWENGKTYEYIVKALREEKLIHGE